MSLFTRRCSAWHAVVSRGQFIWDRGPALHLRACRLISRLPAQMRGCGEFDLVTVAAFIDVDDRSNITFGKPLVWVVSGQRHAIQLFDRVLWDRDPIVLSRLTSATPRQEFMQQPLERGSAPTRWADPAAQVLASLHLCGFALIHFGLIYLRFPLHFKSGGARTVFGVRVRFRGGIHQTAQKPGVFPLPCCEAIPPISHPTVLRAPPESRRSTSNRRLEVLRRDSGETPVGLRRCQRAVADAVAPHSTDNSEEPSADR